MLKWILYLWAAPVTLPMFIVLLFLWMIRQAEPRGVFKRWGFWHWEWQALGGLHDLMGGMSFVAVTIGGGLVLVGPVGGDDDGRTYVLAHEAAHSRQILILGIFQPILYVLSMAVLWIAMPWMEPYTDNPFEQDAEGAAGYADREEVPKRWR